MKRRFGKKNWALPDYEAVSTTFCKESCVILPCEITDEEIID
jgi:hypothetical protein